MPRILRTRTRHLPSRPARPGSDVVDRRPFSAGFPDGPAGRCPRDAGCRSPAASYSEIGKRRQGPDATPFRPRGPRPLPPHATLRGRRLHCRLVERCGLATETANRVPVRVDEPQTRAVRPSSPVPANPEDRTVPPSGDARPAPSSWPVRRAPSAARPASAVPRTRAARSSGDSRPCWIARSRNSAPGTQLGRVPVGMCGWLRTRSAVASGSHHCRGPEQRQRCQSFRKIRVMATGR